MNETKHSWDKHWERYRFGIREDRQIIHQELSSLRWNKIEQRTIKRFGRISGLEVVEIGSGRGEVSALMALKGADVTLMDYSEPALDKAASLYKNIGIKANFIKCDIMNLPENFLNRFDISMSFGLAEHFNYPLRRKVIKIHADLIKPDGVSFIAVPNVHCLPYRLFIRLQKIFGYSQGEKEIPFSRRELKRIADSVGFKTYEVVGSSFIRDSFYFLFSRYISHLTKWRVIVNISSFEIASIFDDYFGYSLVLTGSKT